MYTTAYYQLCEERLSNKWHPTKLSNDRWESFASDQISYQCDYCSHFTVNLCNSKISNNVFAIVIIIYIIIII